MKKVISDRDKRFAEAIGRLMEAHGLSQIALASKAKINPITLNRILNLKQAAGTKASTALAEVFGVDPDDLYAKPTPTFRDMPPMSVRESSVAYGPRLSDLARPGYEPSPVVKTFTPEEVKALLKDELLEVERLKAELESLRAENESLKAQLSNVTSDEEARRQVEHLKAKFRDYGFEALLAVQNEMSIVRILETAQPGLSARYLGQRPTPSSAPQRKALARAQGKKS